MRLILAVIIGLTLSNCGSTPTALQSVEPSAWDLKIINQKIYSSLPQFKISGAAEISPVHRNEALGMPADWAICLRGDTGHGINYFVFLIDHSEIVDSRMEVGLDHCSKQSYAPLPKPEVPKPASPKKPKTTKGHP
jgi:hypothetical protein